MDAATTYRKTPKTKATHSSEPDAFDKLVVDPKKAITNGYDQAGTAPIDKDMTHEGT